MEKNDCALKTILTELSACEREEDVRILFAAESGSRSWGFASEDSDYDVRFVYVRPTSDYLRLENVRDVIDWRLDDELDIVGWDLGKFLRLMRDSNPSTFEWLASDIVYKEEACFQPVRKLAQKCASPRALAHHYLGMATGNAARLCSSETPTLKRYLYVTRAILACKWVMARGENPPMLFDTLCEQMMDEELKPLIGKMVVEKSSGMESDGYGRVPELDAWVRAQLDILTDEVKHLESSAKPSWQDLDDVFLELITHTA